MSTTSSTNGSIRPVVFVYPLGLWVAMAAFAVANGVFRESVLVPQVGERVGHLLSTAILIAAILTLAAVYFGRTTIVWTRVELVLVGVGWVVLTVGFEFLIGYLEGIPIEETLAQYDVLAGQVWIFVPVALLLAPIVFGSMGHTE